MTNTFSQASNFSSSLNGFVDRRTGQFRASFQLANLMANVLKGPSIPFSFRYTPFSDIDYGFGCGWSLIWSSYDSDNQLLLPTNGTFLKISPTSGGGGGQAIKQPIVQGALEKVIFSKIGTQAYSVRYAEGNVDILKGSSYGFNVKVPEKIFSKAGHYVQLAWEQKDENVHRLTSFSDESGTQILSVNYDDELSPIITLWPNTSDSVDIIITLASHVNYNYLTSISIGDDYAWKIGYDYTVTQNFPAPLTSISHVGGLNETVTYTKNGFYLPKDAHSQYRIPYVTNHTVDPGCGQSPIVKNYSYGTDNHNYLGYNTSFISYNENQDNLYYSQNLSYTYTSIEVTTGVGSVNITNQQTFDMFHLLTKETIAQGTSNISIDYSYIRKVGAAYVQQPDNFQCPTGIVKTYQVTGSEAKRKDTESYAFDSQGRLTQYVETDGKTTDITYYPSAGQGTDCPADPTQIGIYPATITQTPPTTDFAAPVHCQKYTYTKLEVGGDENDPSNPISYCILQDTVSHYVDDKLINSVSSKYDVSDPSSSNYGRLIENTSTKYVGTVSYKDTTTFDYELVDYPFGKGDKCVLVTQTLKTYDKLVTTQKNYLSQNTSVLLASEDQLGVATVYKHDQFGRVTSQTRGVQNGGAKSDDSITLNFDYEMYEYASSDPRRYEMETITLANGSKYRRIYDGLKRLYKEQIFFMDQWQDYKVYTYDCLDRLVKTSATDIINRNNKKENINLVENYSYDSWGILSQITRNDGSSKTINNDYINYSTYFVDFYNTHTTKIDYDKNTNLPVLVSRLDSKKTLLAKPVKYSYDGAGRLRQYTDASDQTTAYDYDDWSRLATITRPDGVKVTKSYTDGSSLNLIKSIKVGEVELGTQNFDGLGRITSATVGGRDYTCSYASAGTIRPSSVTDPTNCVSFDYIDEYGMAVKQKYIDGQNISISYNYDKVTGLVTSTSLLGVDQRSPEQDFTYDSLGRVKTIDYKIKNNKIGTVTYNYSMARNIAEYTGIVGGKTSYYYNTNGGALRQIVDSFVSALTPDYNDTGRLTGWTATTGKFGQKVTLQHDKLDRESSRIITNTETNKGIEVVRGYNDDNTVSSRSVYEYKNDLKAGLLSSATYSYDSNKRLHQFTSNGGSFYHQSGAAHARELYTYDDLNNLSTYQVGIDSSFSQEFSYEKTDAVQVSKVKTSATGTPTTTKSVSYDDAGRLTQDEFGRTWTYDKFGKLVRITDGNNYIDYTYDASGLLHGQYVSDGYSRNIYYHQGKEVRIAEQSDGVAASNTVLLNLGHVTPLVVTNYKQPLFAGPDINGSSIYPHYPQETIDASVVDYTPFGCTPDTGQRDNNIRIGYNSEIPDPFAGLYHLGGGYRAYDPQLMRFNSPDSWSPFGAGGINSYGYCGGDPINFTDPTGHMKWWAVLTNYVLPSLAIVASLGLSAYQGVQLARGAVSGLRVLFKATQIAGSLMTVTGSTLVIAGTAIGEQEVWNTVYDSNGNIIDSTDNGKAEQGEKLIRIGQIIAGIGGILLLIGGAGDLWGRRRGSRTVENVDREMFEEHCPNLDSPTVGRPGRLRGVEVGESTSRSRTMFDHRKVASPPPSYRNSPRAVSPQTINERVHSAPMENLNVNTDNHLSADNPNTGANYSTINRRGANDQTIEVIIEAPPEEYYDAVSVQSAGNS